MSGLHRPSTTNRTRRWRSRTLLVATVLSLLALVIQGGPGNAAGGAAGGVAKIGGTAKPPRGAIAPFVEPTLADPTFSQAPTGIHAFTEVGFLQDAKVDNAGCPGITNADNFGGTARINNVTITVPCNMTIQMPANTFTWAQFVKGGPSLALEPSPPTPAPSFELKVVGNIVGSSPTNGRHIAGLMFFSQQALNAGSGYIRSIDYADGSFLVDPGDGGSAVKVQLNDPKITIPGVPAPTGRYSAGQSPDPRLSVDQNNPTVTAATGYPMCVPRTDPATGDDALCPKVNRPRAPGAPAQSGVSQGCRNFNQAGVALPKSGELNPPAPGQVYCSQFVMPDPGKRAATDPDSTKQTPFEAGDHVAFAGTLFPGTGGGASYISAHTVKADIAVYTQPGTKPSYLAIEGSVIGSADPRATAVTGVGQETKDRLALTANTTDVKSPVDIYLPDIDPTSGTIRNRWVTPQAMTGEDNNIVLPSGLLQMVGGGITTQNLGPQPQRARLRANKSPLGLLANPTRLIRIANRVTCQPTAPSGNAFDGTSSTVTLTPVDDCLKNVQLNANGLQAGMYTAPVFDFLFPENVKPGDPIVPNDLWHLGFLRFGEGPNPLTPAVGPLQPTPW